MIERISPDFTEDRAGQRRDCWASRATDEEMVQTAQEEQGENSAKRF
jgi:hypothetical protein